ncbi:hypothetical protein AB1E18_002837 [Capra hircus]
MPESRSLSELTRQIAPPTKNGHAPPPTESRKSYQSVNPVRVRAGINQVGGSERDDEEPGVPVGGGGERQTPARRGSRERRGGPGRALAGPGDPTAPVPPAARTPDRATHPRGPRGSRRVAATAREARGGGGVVRRGGGRRAALLSPSSIPPGPGHTGDGRRAPSASVRPPAPERGGGRRAARTRRPARGGARPGTRPALGRAHRGGGAPSSGTRRRRRRRRHGRRIGAAAGPGSEAHRGTRPRGAADGEGTEADGRAERGTDGMRPRGADTAQPAAGGRSRGATRDEGLAPPPSRGSRPPPPPPPEPQPARGEHSPAAHRRPPPHGPHARGAPPPRPPRSGLSEGTAPLRPGTPPARQGPGDDTHVKARRGRLGPGQGTGTRAVARAGRGEARRGRRRRGGAGEHARRGPRDRDAGAVRGPEEKDRATRPGPQEHQRGIPPPPAREGGPATPGAPAGPGHPRSVARDPAPPPGSVFRLSLNPEARPPGDDALERGGPDRDRTPPPAAAQGARAGLTPRGPAARTRPPTCRTPGGAQRDPPPTRRGEARAADLDREKARVPRDASGDRTPRGDRTRASPGPPSGPHLRSATRKTPRAERTRGPGPRRALRRPPSHRPGRSPPPERGRRRSKRS